MQYTEEHYAQMYNDLPEGLKELVLSGRLAILVSAIGSRHGLNADQVADLEPAIEDVCLGLITKDELVDNIAKNVNLDQRVSNRIAADAEIEILKPFEAELLIARKQKEDLDEKISQGTKTSKPQTQPVAQVKTIPEPKDVSEHATEKKVSDWYNKNDSGFDWDKSLSRKEEPETTAQPVQPTLEKKLDVLTESINKLVNSRFGSDEKKDAGLSTEMQELVKRLEKAEKENEENKRLIRSLQTQKTSTPTESIFGESVDQNKIQIDKQRKIEINKEATKLETKSPSNVQVTSISNNIPIENKKENRQEQEIVSSSVSKDTIDSIMEIRNKPTLTAPTQTSTKKVLSLDELISKGDNKIKEGTKVGTLVFPGVNDEKKVDIKNVAQKDSLKQTLLDDLEFLKQPNEMDKVQNEAAEKTSTKSDASDQNSDDTQTNLSPTTSTSQISSTTTNLFKEELLPKTKEERMKALQDKIKALNKGVSVGGKTNISASGLDPYKI